MEQNRRDVLAAGAAVAAVAAAAPNALAAQQQNGLPGTTRFYEKGNVKIAYQDVGRGFPLLLIAGGGLQSRMAGLVTSPFNPIAEFSNEFRCIYADLRNATQGQSTGPLEIDRPWDSYTDDHLGLMDHLGVNRFMVLGFCIGGPFIWNLMRRAPDRVVAAVPAQPVGFRPEAPTVLYDGSKSGWAVELMKQRPDITADQIERFLTKMYRTNADFVFTATRDFVKTCQTPVLILPDDVPAHPLAVAMECAMLAPKAEVSMYPWKEPKERIPLAVRQVRSFLKSHRPTTA
jgi:pimeloyl-ACP methyl ester carboxylesterase